MVDHLNQASEAPVLLRLRDIALTRNGLPLVQGLSLDIQAGQVWCVLGENGAGKSSLLAGMVDYIPLDDGHVAVLGKPLQQLSPTGRASAISWLPQSEPDTLSVTVLERVLLSRHPFVDSFFRDSSADLEIAEAALADVGLAAYENRMVRQLSGGERRRVSLAACLAQQTPVMLLDEPLAALDLRHQQLLINRFKRVAAAGRAVVWITHDPNQALSGATHVLLLQGDGKWVAGKSEDVLTARQLSLAYHADVRELDADGHRFFYIPPATIERAGDVMANATGAQFEKPDATSGLRSADTDRSEGH